MSGFVHLHVASGYSLRYGTARPEALVERAASLGQEALALTDRDGAYGAVAFALACREAGISPILGADLAVAVQPRPAGPPQPVGPPQHRTNPARGGVCVDPDHPRIVLLARGSRGWASLSRAISAAHLSGERGQPVLTVPMLAELSDGLVALLGPDSDVGRALARRRPDEAARLLAAWRDVFGADLRIEVVSHRGGSRSDRTTLSSALAGRMLSFAGQVGVTPVLTNAVRYLVAGQAPVADVLDAIRRLVPLDPRHLDRANAQGYLKGAAEMLAVADEVAAAAGMGLAAARRLVAQTIELAGSCRIDPAVDLGIGTVHVPELDVLFPTGAAGLAPGESLRAAPAAAQARMADRILRHRCQAAVDARFTVLRDHRVATERLEGELATIAALGYGGYFLTVAEVVDLIRGMGIRVAARGSGAGSLVNHLLGISGVNPLAHGLIMERFLSPLRQALPDIDIDVESARRTEIYTRILARFGGERCVAVSMMETYRVRHAIRDVGAALGLPPGEIDVFAKAFPHIRARDARAALADLPELRSSGMGRLAATGRLDGFLDLVESLDGLPRHVALHPCGVLLSDGSLLDRTPVEASWMGFPMSQFDKDAVEEMGFLKLDVLGIRMQSAMAHALTEVVRLGGEQIDLDAVPLDDPDTFAMIRTTHTLGCFQIESPGQRELIGKFAPETFDDIVVDISLFRPGPVKSDMVTPFLRARQGWADPDYLHPDLKPVLAQTRGVVVFHEQVIGTIATITGCSLAQADEIRRSMGSPEGQAQVRAWFYPQAMARGYRLEVVERVWDVLRSFASFGFCKAHAAAFALPTYQSAWLKTHHPAAFLAGVLTHDPGMYPKRLILDDARNLGISVLGIDVNRSGNVYRVEQCPTPDARPTLPGLPDGSAHGIRLPLTEVKGISSAEVERIVAGQPYGSLSDFWTRADVSTPVVENLVLTGGFDAIYGIGPGGVRRRGQVTRRDLLLEVADSDRLARSARSRSGRGRSGRAAAPAARRADPQADRAAPVWGVGSAGPGGAGHSSDPPSRSLAGVAQRGRIPAGVARPDPVLAAAAQSQAPSKVQPSQVQLALDLPTAGSARTSGLPEMSAGESVRAELDVLGMDVSHHVLDFYRPMLADLGVVPARDLLAQRSQSEVWVAGVKVATQTPPIRTGRRVVFLTIDDSTGPIDATFFEDAQDPYAATVFAGWLLMVRGLTRRTGPRGLSVRATGCWDLGVVHEIWKAGGRQGVVEYIGQFPQVDSRRHPAAQVVDVPVAAAAGAGVRSTSSPVGIGRTAAGGMGQRRRVLLHASGFKQSPYADVKPAGEDPASVPRSQDQTRAPGKLWHASPGSSGW
ncbi:MAG: DNA polymerase III subunit alpha [Candidatus Nanopelagicales bacterium]